MTEPTSSSLRETIGDVLARIPSGLFILTARARDGRTTGMLASWVQQASFEPPMLTFALHRKRFLHDWLQQDPEVALNLLGEGQKQFLKHFSQGFGPDEAAFEGLTIRSLANGIPVLTDALGYLAGRVADRLETGDHVIYALLVTEAGTGPDFPTLRPWVHVRKNGFNY